ncbi:two-component system response regulator AlgR [Methylohalomonas lacus]|uniref:Two-component system response regulator AlgR n=1 Tax=Methylohalomonas lacus TaxID=398773 RepID=A0AAE3HKS5_9GAMM|nr:LytTR family DNA-binding domain-containing protein [Methylohalomonas lacus]MCS3904161.1 two-component system response regulator AlgR [Methylohalomonas lacus]
MRILIADDEQPARERLRALVEDIGGHDVVAEAGNGIEVIAQLEPAQPDVVLLDIRMPGMDGLETADHLSKLTPAPAVIFTTAYQDHALAAFESNAVDYLLKPIRRDRLAQAFARAEVVSRGRLAEIRREENSNVARSYLSAVIQGRIQLASLADIRYFRAEQKYVTAAWPDGELLLDESLKQLEDEFGDQFLRIHRNALVALRHVEALKRDNDGNNEIHLRDMDTALKVSRRHLSQVRKRLRGLG